MQNEPPVQQGHSTGGQSSSENQGNLKICSPGLSSWPWKHCKSSGITQGAEGAVQHTENHLSQHHRAVGKGQAEEQEGKHTNGSGKITQRQNQGSGSRDKDPSLNSQGQGPSIPFLPQDLCLRQLMVRGTSGKGRAWESPVHHF